MAGKLKIFSFFVLLLGILLALIFSNLPLKLPKDKILKLAQNYNNKENNNNEPLINKIVIITGSTSGLGKSIAMELYEVESLFYSSFLSCFSPISFSSNLIF